LARTAVFRALAWQAPASDRADPRWPVRSPPRLGAREHVVRRGAIVECSSSVCPVVRSSRTRARFGTSRRGSIQRSPVTRPSGRDPRLREPRGVDRVIGMMMAEPTSARSRAFGPSVADAAQIVREATSRVRPRSPASPSKISGDRPGHPPSSPSARHTPMASTKHPRGPARSNLHISHRADTTDTPISDQIGTHGSGHQICPTSRHPIMRVAFYE